MTSVEFVEKALIGSLLNDSTRRDELPWLRAEDFTIPLCLAIWRHLESGKPPHCQPLTDLVDLSEALGRDCELHPRLRSPAELATLQLQAPEKPAVVEYGRILVEATIRREVAAMGLQLESLAAREPEQIIDRGRGRADISRGAGPTPENQHGPAERRRHRSHCCGSVRLR
jgi:replicative DNA helicase